MVKFIIKSKEKKNLSLFVCFLKKVINKKYLKFTTTSFKTQKSLFSLLKSPHVFKNSQEHTGFYLSSKKISLFLLKKTFFFLLIKKFINIIFSNIFLKITSIYDNLHLKNQFLNIFNPNTFILIFDFLTSYLKIFDIFGEICLNKKVFK